MNVELDGTAVVTGAGRGIGAALAVALATAGMRVGLIGRTGAALAGTAASCPHETVCAVADVTDEAELVAALACVQDRFGPVDLLVNNAAIADATECLLWTVDAGSWWSVVETNLRGPFLACRLTLPGMVRRGHGRVVNINSGMGMRSSARYSAYSVSKAGLARLTSCLAESAREYGVAVFDVSPGHVRTALTARMPCLATVSADTWVTTEPIQRLLLDIATGRLDALSGCHLHAVRDDLDDLLAHAAEIAATGSRTLGLLPYRTDDPAARPQPPAKESR